MTENRSSAKGENGERPAVAGTGQPGAGRERFPARSLSASGLRPSGPLATDGRARRGPLVSRLRFAGRLLAAWTLLALSTPALPEETELYRRVLPAGMRTGVVALSETIEPRIDVPVKCTDGKMSCFETRTYARAYRIEFSEERQEVLTEGAELWREPRGTILLALAFSSEDERAYDEELRGVLAGLAASAFELPFAGLDNDAAPFDPGTIASRAELPSWACFESDERRRAVVYRRQLGEPEDGRPVIVGLGSATYPGEETAGPLCDAIRQATEQSWPEQLRTVPALDRLVETVVTVRTSDRLSDSVYGDQLMPLPAEARLTRRARPGVVSGESNSIGTDGSIFSSSVARDEVETTAVTVSAELPLEPVVASSWTCRFRIESIERTPGPLPRETVLDLEEAAMTLVPTAPPRAVDSAEEETDPGSPVEPDAQFGVRLDADRLLAEIASRLASEATLDMRAVERAATEQPAGLDEPGWVLVWCGSDGEADWGLPPTLARSPVLNAREICAEIFASSD